MFVVHEVFMYGHFVISIHFESSHFRKTSKTLEQMNDLRNSFTGTLLGYAETFRVSLIKIVVVKGQKCHISFSHELIADIKD